MHPPQSVSISTATFVKAVLIVLGIWFLWYVRDVVAIFIAALLLSSLIEPFAATLHARNIPRALAVLIVYTVLLTLVSLLMVLLVPAVSTQGGQLLSYISSSYTDAAQSFGSLQRFSQTHGLEDNFLRSLSSLQDTFTQSVGSVFSTVKGLVGGLVAMFVVMVLAFYMVVEEEKVKKYFTRLAPFEYQPYVGHLMKKMQRKMGEWLRGQLILAFVIGTVIFVGLSILGVPYALLLALMAGILEVVPYVGPVLSVIPALVIGFAQSPVIGLAVLLLYIIVQQLENHVLVPKIMQTVTGLNPIISILALLVGIKVAGLVGAILSIPLAMMGVVILEDLFGDMD
jgi:predicted PurR-regulated permease PerM